MSASVLFKIHSGKQGERTGLDQRLIGGLAELLDDPIALLSSATVPGALVVFTSAALGGGHVVVSVEADKREANSPINVVTSAYAKDRATWLVEQIDAGRLKYWDEKKGLGIPEVSSITLKCDAEPGSQNPLSGNILGPEDVIKYRAHMRKKRLG